MNSEEIKERQQKEEEEFIFSGTVKEYHKNGNRLYLMLERRKLAIEFLSADIFRVLMAREELDFSTTPAVIDHGLFLADFEVEERTQYLKVTTSALVIEINLTSFSLAVYNREGQLISRDSRDEALGWSGKKLRVCKRLAENEKIYGLGEKTGFLNKRDEIYTMWNTDNYEAHVPSSDPLYQSIPFIIGLNDNNLAYGLYFDNSARSEFDLGHRKEDYLSYTAEGGKLDYYFIGGPALKQVVERYTSLTGRTPLPPLWSLGYHQSRYSYYPESEVKQVAETLREKDIPCDALHLDIHYLDGYRVFTWDEKRFPDPEKMLEKLGEQGFKVVTIIDPGVKVDPEYGVYRQGINNDYFCRYLDGRLYTGEVWPGESVFPDFSRREVRNWWGELNKKLLAQGVTGIWNDMNEPSVFNDRLTMDPEVIHENEGRQQTHRLVHNIYALLQNMATRRGMEEFSEERAFILTRAGFAGIQRYAAVWTGDNRSFWQHLRLAMPMMMNLGLSGVAFCGTDVGGFTGDCRGELLTRWTQLGTFMPFFRNHTSLGTRPQEPWAFGEEYEDIIRKYIKLRYRYLYFIYNLFYWSRETGLPLLQPLVMNYQQDEITHEIYDQFMIGDSLLVAPIYRPGKDRRLVYLPAGRWYDYWEGEWVAGGDYTLKKAPLDILPLYVKAGSILPAIPTMNYSGQRKLKQLTFEIYPGSEQAGNYLYYEDDGISFGYREDEFNLKEIEFSIKGEKINLSINNRHRGYQTDYSQYCFVVKTDKYQPGMITIDGEKIKYSHQKLDSGSGFEIMLDKSPG